MSWTKVNGQMPNRAIDQNGVLVIPNVRPEDAGNYECTGSDMFHMATDLATLIVSGEFKCTLRTCNEFKCTLRACDEFKCTLRTCDEFKCTFKNM